MLIEYFWRCSFSFCEILDLIYTFYLPMDLKRVPNMVLFLIKNYLVEIFSCQKKLLEMKHETMQIIIKSTSLYYINK